MSIFSDIKGLVLAKSMVGSGRNSNSFKRLCMSSLPAKNEEDPINT